MSPALSFLPWLLLYFQRGQGELICAIKQKELIIMAVVNETVNIQCEFSCRRPKPVANMTASPLTPTEFNVLLYKDNSGLKTRCLGKGMHWMHFTRSCQVTVEDTERSGMYYCRRETASRDRKAEGTLVQIRNAVHMETSHSLRNVLTAVCVILALYSLSATSVILIKRKICYSCKTQLRKSVAAETPKQSDTPQMTGSSESQQRNEPHLAEAADTDQTYMPLQTHQQSVYSTLHNDKTSTNDCSGSNETSKECGTAAHDEVYESF
ncbi:uncharacterized protein LOC119956583 isoform X1 [Scyliorhinus canicula]|uniref:uncharacterized protein LOC119956583 isoform X1 n=1 Tax=Scyliorhinus canicula TaxID=7830 RepID=UPI0018F6CF50|nr:uncharacterized protein LOC119956583 isoform X1 [Scyliorhinus canicula]